MRTQLADTVLASSSGQRADEILRSCVHCGFCNATCPTYQLLGDELDGPRGRIYLVKDMLESGAPNPVARKHLDRCLTCRACETTCPSGVRFGELAEIGRELLQEQGSGPGWFMRLVLRIVPRPKLFGPLVALARACRWLLPRRLRRGLLPSGAAHRALTRGDAPLPAVPAAKPSASAAMRRALLWQGCAQRVVTPEVNAHLARLLQARGIAVATAAQEGCCGGLALHYGCSEQARAGMRRNVAALSAVDADVVVSTASGCGTTLKDYGRLLAEPQAEAFAAKVRDVSEVLAGFKFSKRAVAGRELARIAWHPPCTLQHGQGLRGEVERMLRGAGYHLVPVADADVCCGSAGAYSLLQPKLADELRQRKVAALARHAPEAVATANIGCQMHLAAGLDVPVVHWLELLA